MRRQGPQRAGVQRHIAVQQIDPIVVRRIQAGAHGYVSKEAPPEELLRAIESVYEGQSFFSPEIARAALNQLVSGGKGFINGLLQPGEVKTIEIQTPYDAKMNANSWNFSHANGPVKPHQVKALDDPNAATKKEPAAKTASAKKK